jgi:hypothetical protein
MANRSADGQVPSSLEEFIREQTNDDALSAVRRRQLADAVQEAQAWYRRSSA